MPTGGNTLTSPTVTGDPPVVDFADVGIAQNGANPTAVRYSVVYNSSDAQTRAVGFVDWGAPQDFSAGNNTITITSGIFDLSGQ